MTQKERQERSREEICQAALEEFGTHGYDRVNMERICGRHGISKGMMYHYYSNKDELFLLCAERTFADLKAYVEGEMEGLGGESALDGIKNFFLIREYFFQDHPRQKVIFEEALLHPPKHLVERIRELRRPIREINRRFIRQLVDKMPLRPDVDPKKAARYLESVEYFFQSAMKNYQAEGAEGDLHTMFEIAGEMLDMVLFGILSQPEPQDPK